MYGQSVDIVPIRFNYPLHKPILNPQNHRKLRPAIQLRRPNTRIIDLRQGAKMDIRIRDTMVLRGLHYDAGGGRIWQLGGLP